MFYSCYKAIVKHFLYLWRVLLALCCMFLVFHSNIAHARGLIRDTEIESTLREFVTPILKAASLEPESVSLFIVNDSSINAFVAGGSNIFIHTGLILASDDPSMLIGVLAHEVGHIAGGHLARGTEALQNAQLGTIIGYVIGAAAALGGGGEAGSAVMSASQQLAQRQLLSFTRMNEQSADQAALQYLESIGISPAGLLELMEKLRIRETIYRKQLDPYALTHPLSKERIAHIRGHLLQHDSKDKTLPTETTLKHQRMHAKLTGFLNTPETVLQRYDASDSSVSAHYARAIALHRLSMTDAAIEEMDMLLAKSPNDPYFLELKGQILAESGKEPQALEFYKQALKQLPNAPLLLAEYGRLLLAKSPPNTIAALKYLKQANLLDRNHITTWTLLGQVYKQIGNEGQSALAYAEAALLTNQLDEALRYIDRALSLLSKDSPARLRAEDLQAEVIRLKEK